MYIMPLCREPAEGVAAGGGVGQNSGVFKGWEV